MWTGSGGKGYRPEQEGAACLSKPSPTSQVQNVKTDLFYLIIVGLETASEQVANGVQDQLPYYAAKSVLREEGPRVKFCLVTLLSNRSLKKVAECEVFSLWREVELENLLKLPLSSPFSLFYFSISMSLSLQEGETLSGVDHEEDHELYPLIVIGPIEMF